MATDDKISMCIPFIPSYSANDLPTVSEQIAAQGLELKIASVNWREAFPLSMPVSVYMAHNQSYIFVQWVVQDPAVLGRYTEDNSAVYKDSCVEFFCQTQGETVSDRLPYINFEFNCLGAMRASVRYSRTEVIRSLTTEEFAQIKRLSSVSPSKGLSDSLSMQWSLLVAIPLELLMAAHYGLQSAAHQEVSIHSLRANFYKCGDETAVPHYLSWQPILTPKPDFHRPDYFGELKLLADLI